jgi:tetratricopeptide (TPR) repeat protein
VPPDARPLAWCFSAEGKLDEAADSSAVAESFFLEAGDEPNACYARLAADEHLRYKSSTDEIEARYQALIERCEKAVPVLVYMVRCWRGLTRTYRQDWEGAGTDLELAYDYSKSAELLDMAVTAGIGLLLVDHARGHHDRRRERMEELRRAATELDDHHHWSVVQRAEARFALVDGDFESAERHARRGLRIFGHSGNVLHETEIKVSLARALIGQKRFEEARGTIRETAAAVTRQLRRVGVVSLAALAEWYLVQGKRSEAQNLLGLTLAYRDAHNVSIPNVEAEYIASLQQILDAEPSQASVTDEQVVTALTEG